MTTDERKRIERLRKSGNSFSRISEITGLSPDSIRMYCKRNGIAPNGDKTSRCLECGKELLPKGRGRTALFCSDTCRVLYWRTQKYSTKDRSYLHICNRCGDEFFSAKSSRKYCSHTCYIKARFGEKSYGA